ncbi:Exodeoxyribonuclease III [hydrothermal vent metagenome]|uniref:Exodeoxyribonuclease III n=1 Tax=hydrothermal vent metagenome TaxID=652676 RepID=A0A3B0TAX4_9ZZZZ
MRIASWNINGIKARLETITAWLEQQNQEHNQEQDEQQKLDIVCLQEIKSVDENFPRQRFEDLGYNVRTHGQKGFNGVAILSRLPFDEVHSGLPGDDNDQQARLIEGVFSTSKGSIRVCNIYLPNGNPVERFQDKWPHLSSSKTRPDKELEPGFVPTKAEMAPESEKFSYKLAWMERLDGFVKERLKLEEPFILVGDFNLIPAEIDCHDPKAWWGDALFRPESLEKFRALINLGLTDALRATSSEPSYTFWDFQGGAWRRNNGIRIDHLLLSPQAADRLEGVVVHKDLRGWDKPSDHVAIEGNFSF